MNRWLDRPAYLAALSFVGGGAVAAAIILLVVFARGDGNGTAPDDQVRATATAQPSPGATAPPTAPGAATPTPSDITDPDEALTAFIRDELGAEHIGDCPSQLFEEQEPPMGVCSRKLHEEAELVTHLVGAPFSEFFGEVVLTRREDGTWSINFVEPAPVGEMIEVGDEAVVFGAGSCLRFREEPGLDAEVRSCWIDGTRGRVVEGPTPADGHTWWRLEGLGWASDQYLRPAGQ